MAQGLPHFDVSSFLPQIFWLIVFFSALYYLLAKIALPKIAMQLKVRQEYIDSILQDAQKIKSEVESIKSTNDEKLLAAKHEAQEIILEAEKNSKKSMVEIENIEIEKTKIETENKKQFLQKQLNEINADAIVSDITDYLIEKFNSGTSQPRLRKVS